LHVTGALNYIYMHSEHQLRSSISLKDRAFLSRVSTLTRDIDIANLSVCLSVRPSVCYVPVSDENGLTYRHSFSPYGSPIILVYQHQTSSRNSEGFTRTAGALNTRAWGIKISRFSRNRYISQMIQDIAIVTMQGE